jgi:hypothetical protein
MATVTMTLNLIAKLPMVRSLAGAADPIPNGAAAALRG